MRKMQKNAHAHSLSAHRLVRTKPLSVQIALWIQFLLATSMDSECPTPNVQPSLDAGATPSAEACDQRAATARSRASESTEARDRKLARDRARRRERLASETAEEKERSYHAFSQRVHAGCLVWSGVSLVPRPFLRTREEFEIRGRRKARERVWQIE